MQYVVQIKFWFFYENILHLKANRTQTIDIL